MRGKIVKKYHAIAKEQLKDYSLGKKDTREMAEKLKNFDKTLDVKTLGAQRFASSIWLFNEYLKGQTDL